MRGSEVKRLVDVNWEVVANAKERRREKIDRLFAKNACRVSLFFCDACFCYTFFSSFFVQHIHTISQCTTTIYYTMNTVYGKQTTENSNRMMKKKKKEKGKKNSNQIKSIRMCRVAPTPFLFGGPTASAPVKLWDSSGTTPHIARGIRSTQHR